MKFKTSKSARSVQNRIKELARQIISDYDREPPYLIAIANGGCYIGVDLSRALFSLGMDTEIAFPGLSTYGDSQTPTKEPAFQKDFYTLPLKNRHVLFVEDILDTGKTIKYAVAEAEKLRPKSVKTLFLFAKPASILKVRFAPDYIGFRIPAKWAKGNGLDTNGLGRGDGRLLLRTDG